MKIVPIFVEDSEGLHSIHYNEEDENEFQRLFDLWNDYEYLLQFSKENQASIFDGYYGISKLEEFVEAITDEAYELEQRFIEYSEKGFFVNSSILQSIFKPLKNFETALPVLQLSKARVEDFKYFKKPKLRLYALRVNANTFILTGGCIKLSHLMDENEHTRLELEKLEKVRKWLINNEIRTVDELTYYYEE